MTKKTERTSIERSMNDNEEDRIRGNTFINIPKVQTYPGFGEVKKEKYKTTKRKKEKPKLKDKLKNIMNVHSIRKNPIMGKSHFRGKKGKLVNSNQIGKPKMPVIETPIKNQRQLTDLKKYNQIQRAVEMKRLFQNTMTLNENNKLRENIFDNQDPYNNNLNSTPRRHKAPQSNSRLEYLFDSKPRPQNVVKEQSSGFNMISEMGSRQNNSFQTEETQTSRGSMLKKGLSLRENPPKIKVKELLHKESRIDDQLRQISLKELQREINKFMKNPNRNLLIDSILAQNNKLESLKIDLYNLNQSDSQNLAKELGEKQNVLQKKQKELWKIVEELRNSGQIVGPTLFEKHQRISFEQSLSPEELKIRKQKVNLLRKMDKRCQNLEKDLENFDRDMEIKFNRILDNKKDVIAKEENNLLEALEDDYSNKLLIQEMERMVRNINR
jgi:hypothetical protein